MGKRLGEGTTTPPLPQVNPSGQTSSSGITPETTPGQEKPSVPPNPVIEQKHPPAQKLLPIMASLAFLSGSFLSAANGLKLYKKIPLESWCWMGGGLLSISAGLLNLVRPDETEAPQNPFKSTIKAT